MRDIPPRRSILLFILLIVGISILLFNDFGKSHSLVIDSILDFGHVPLFCVVTAMVLWVLEWRRWPMTTTRNYILAGAISGGLAVLTEVLQQLTPERSFQVGDIIHDLTGSAVFLLFAYQYKRNLQKRNQLIMIIIAGVLLIIAGIPVLATSIDELRSRKEFPLLASFETWTEMKRWSIEDRNERSPLHATQGQRSLCVNLSPGLYPGVSFNHPPANWQGYDNLSFDVYLDGTVQLPLTVRINDLEHNDEFEDRYNQTFILKPGQNRVSISLSEVEHAPKGRLMDMEHISILCIFSYKLKAQRTVYFDNFRLEKKD